MTRECSMAETSPTAAERLAKAEGFLAGCRGALDLDEYENSIGASVSLLHAATVQLVEIIADLLLSGAIRAAQKNAADRDRTREALVAAVEALREIRQNPYGATTVQLAADAALKRIREIQAGDSHG